MKMFIIFSKVTVRGSERSNVFYIALFFFNTHLSTNQRDDPNKVISWIIACKMFVIEIIEHSNELKKDEFAH